MSHLAGLAAPSVARYWTAAQRDRYERQIWLAVLRMHHEWGVAPGVVTNDAVAAYEAQVDADTAARAVEIERTTRHDLKARIEAWNEQVGHQAIHLGMTSADIVENAAQAQVRGSAVALLAQLAGRGGDWELAQLERAIRAYPLRGIQGAVGTGQDQVDLTGRKDAPALLTAAVAARLGFATTVNSVGQVYPRSVDLVLASAAIAACTSASARPGLMVAAHGYLDMLCRISGDQWNEGDVSTSVVRRVALPGLFLACSAALDDVCGVRTLT